MWLLLLSRPTLDLVHTVGSNQPAFLSWPYFQNNTCKHGNNSVWVSLIFMSFLMFTVFTELSFVVQDWPFMRQM